MTSEFAELPDTMLRLDDLLADGGDDAMLLSELDGFLCGIVVSPTPVAQDEWWPLDWLADERGMLKPGNEEIERLVLARLGEIETELASGEYGPLYEVDDETDEIVWEVWIAGFQQAMLLRFEAWDELLRATEDDTRGEAAMGLASGLMLSDAQSQPDDTATEEDWAQYDAAVEAMPEVLAQTAVLLYRMHRQE